MVIGLIDVLTVASGFDRYEAALIVPVLTPVVGSPPAGTDTLGDWASDIA